jgi:hypothetical protein
LACPGLPTVPVCVCVCVSKQRASASLVCACVRIDIHLDIDIDVDIYGDPTYIQYTQGSARSVVMRCLSVFWEV